MRQINFRGKLSHSKEWIEGNLIIANNEKPYIIPSEIFEPDGHHLRIDSDNPFWVISETVGQSINRNDINDKEAFTDDIIQRLHEDALGRKHLICGVIFYDDSKLEYRIKNIRSETYISDCDSMWIGHYFKIIGSIHDTPELLTK